jgi:hypothetical protein
MGQAHVTTRKSLGQTRTSPWLRHLCADSDSHSQSQRVLAESTMWWFAVLPFLLGFSTPDIIVVDQRPGNATSARNVIIEAVNSTQ